MSNLHLAEVASVVFKRRIKTQIVLIKREKIKRPTIEHRRLQHCRSASYMTNQMCQSLT